MIKEFECDRCLYRIPKSSRTYWSISQYIRIELYTEAISIENSRLSNIYKSEDKNSSYIAQNMWAMYLQSAYQEPRTTNAGITVIKLEPTADLELKQ